MKKLHFDYYTNISYTENATDCHFKIKCIPAQTDRQCIENLSVDIDGGRKYSESLDTFGTRELNGSVPEPHKSFYFRISGTATTGICDSEGVGNESILALFKHGRGLTKAGDNIKAYYNAHPKREGQDNLDWAVELMHNLYRDFKYEKNVTNVKTTAEEALTLGRGVCQDYAHIMLSILRYGKVPARYVCGMLIGEGYSHAWVEVYNDGRWYGVDPTNDLIVTDSHIKIGVGRDAWDCRINHGIMRGGGVQSQEISVSVEEIQ